MYYQQYGKKYKNISSYYNGYHYASKLEANLAHSLDLLMKAKDPKQRVKAWQRQVRIPLEVNGLKICTYIPDFRVEYEDGRIVFMEAKGYETDVYKIKKKLFEAIYLKEHPECEYQVIK